MSTTLNFYRDNARLLNVWHYLWTTYRENGSTPRHISDAISLIQSRLTGAP